VILAFDVYGTLSSTHGVVTALREVVGEKADEFSRNWREKQLEYSFRRGLMQNYVDFSICTEHAPTYVSEHHKLVLSETQKGTLLSAYRVLPTFDDVGDALDDLKSFKPNPQLFTAIYCAAQG
jgi:2-haloacid dehalogenase